MSKIIFSAVLFLAFFTSNNANSLPSNNSENKFELFYSHFENLEASSNFSVSVTNLIIKRDIGTFYLEKGDIYFCEPYEGRIFSGVFVGDGVFNYTPPNEIEVQQLKRFYEKEDVNEKFNNLFFLFADSTYFEITKQFSIQEKECPREINSIIRRSAKYFYDDSYEYIDGDYTKTILDNKYNNFFSAQFTTIDNGGFLTSEDRLFYTINPFDIEDVTFAKGDSRFGHYWKNVINKFSSSEHKKQIDYNKFNERFISISKYDIDCKIESDLDFSAVAAIDFSYNYTPQHWIYFNLYSDLEVDSVIWEDGNKAIYTKEDDAWQLWIKVNNDSSNMSLNQKLKVYYHGDILERVEGYWIQLKTISKWFPRSGIQRSNYHLTFNYPAKFKLASVGENYFFESNDDITTSKWKSKNTLLDASFSIGSYNEFNIENDTIPNITIYNSKRKGFGFNRDMEEEVGVDIENSLIFYEALFGKPNFSKLQICEHPYGHGQAFPGFINLSWSTFVNTSAEGEDEIFRAHEVAHQWWGIGVGYKTYHDKWLSEGFSTYSSLLYMSAVLRDNEKLFEYLESWRERILDNRKYLFGAGQEAGPIWLGYRTESKETSGDYSLIIYKKSAWVLHMLRNLMTDLSTLNDEKFYNLLSDYYKSFLGKEATTEDFINICNKHFGSNMGWFFDQWIYGTSLPSYSFSYKYEKNEAGKYLITCKVKQSGVLSNFLAYVPIKINFSENRFVRLRVKVTGSESTFTLPLVPFEPDEIIFNDLESVLCEVEYDDWE